MPETRQAAASQSAEFRTDMRETMRSELNDFFRSSEFKEILSKAVSTLVEESVQQATKPLLENIEALEAELTNVRVQANENEQYFRKYNLRIVGLNENDGENCVGEIIKLCKGKLNVNVDERDIDRAHRLGPKALSGRSRTVIVKFKSYGAKAEIYRQRKLLKGTQYYINLTKI
jgi:exosome complex exonuclease DIS3/RRP44